MGAPQPVSRRYRGRTLRRSGSNCNSSSNCSSSGSSRSSMEAHMWTSSTNTLSQNSASPASSEPGSYSPTAATPVAAAAAAAAAAAEQLFLSSYCRPFSCRRWDILWASRTISLSPLSGGPSCGGPPRPPTCSKGPRRREWGPLLWGVPWGPWGSPYLSWLRQWTGPFVLGAGVAVCLACVGKLWGGARGPQEAPFSQFLLWLRKGYLQQVSVHQVASEQFVYFRLKPNVLGSRAGGPQGAGGLKGGGPCDFVAKMLPGAEALVAQLLVSAVAGHEASSKPAAAAVAAAAAGDTLQVQALPSSTSFAIWDLLVLLVSLGGLAVIAGSHCSWLQQPFWGRADSQGGGPPKVTFADVAGGEELKARLLQAAQLLTNPNACASIGAKPPRGILLEGPTGTGKTLAARALAGEAGVPFLYANASSLVEVFAGRGAARVRKLFAEANRLSPCVLFFDEVDAIGAHRFSGSGACQEYVQTLNQLLTLMDGLETSGKRILVLAATNRADSLDEALLRPGRFDQILTVNLPDEEERIAILALHFRGVSLHPSVSLAHLAAVTDGFSGACLSALCNESALLAARRGLAMVGPSEVSEALGDMRRAGRGGRAAAGPPASAAAAAAAVAAQHHLFKRGGGYRIRKFHFQSSMGSEGEAVISGTEKKQQQQQQQQKQQLCLSERQLRAGQESLLRQLAVPPGGRTSGPGQWPGAV